MANGVRGWKERTGSILLSISELWGPAVFWAVPEPAVAWLPDAPKTPPVLAPCLLPRPSRSLSTLGSTLLAMFDCQNC